MPNFTSIYNGPAIDTVIGAVNNFRPQITVTGLSNSTVVTCTKGSVTLTETAGIDGTVVFNINSYGTWNLSATGLSTSVVVDKIKKYTVSA